MKLNTKDGVLILIISSHLYIIFLNTSSVHGLPVLDTRLWTGVLFMFMIPLFLLNVKNRAISKHETFLYFSLVLALGCTVLNVFGLTIQTFPYSLIILSSSLLVIPALFFHPHPRVLTLNVIFILGWLVLASRIFRVNSMFIVSTVLVEAAILFAIVYYNYKVGLRFDELFIVIIVTFVGYQFGVLFSSYDVPSLIFGTLFEQTLSVSQYQVNAFFDRDFFLALHLAEVFNILTIQLILRRSKSAMAIIITGIEMTYPPILFLRSLAILMFMRSTVSLDQISEHPNNTRTAEFQQPVG